MQGMSSGRVMILMLVFAAVGLLGGRGLAHLGAGASARPGSCTDRVVCLGPAVVEILFQMDQADRLVGIDSYSSYPPAVEQIRRVGGMTDPDLEAILTSRAGLVVTMGHNRKLDQLTRSSGSELLVLPIDSLEQLDRAVQSLGSMLQAKQAAETLREKIKEQLNHVESHTDKLSRPRVFFSITYTTGKWGSLTTIGGVGFLNQLIEIAGGSNIFDDLSRAYPHVSREQVLLREPDVIVIACPGMSLGKVDLARLENQWRQAGLPEHVPVHVLPQEYLLIPGPRVIKTAWALARVLHGQDVCGCD